MRLFARYYTAPNFSGFTIFHFTINLAGFTAPLLTQYLATKVFNVADTISFNVVFISAGVAMLCSLICFWNGRNVVNAVSGFYTSKLNHTTASLIATGLPIMVKRRIRLGLTQNCAG